MNIAGNRSQHESDANSQIFDQARTKIEAIKNALMKFDKDVDSEIDQQELLAFLDSNMKNGQKFDRALANKIFEALDLDKSGKITVEEFIRNFISIEEEIKAHAKELQSKHYAEKEKYANIQKMLLENQNEKLNAEGIGENAKITIDIYNIEFLRQFGDKLKRISIKIRFGNEAKETRMASGAENVVVWKEKFEFKVARKDILYFDVINTDESRQKSTLGSVKFPLNKIEKQDEYDLELEIPDENDDNQIMAKINAKIQFVWSIYKYYQDLLNKSEKIIQNCGAMIQKTNKLLENLNEPLKFFETVENKIQPSEDNTTKDFNYQNPKLSAPIQPTQSQMNQYEIADKLENLIKTTFKKPNIPWMPLIKLLLIINIALGYINLLARSDFLDIVVPSLILVIFYTTINNNVVRYLQLFLIAIGSLLLFEIVWIYFSLTTYAGGSLLDAGKENSLRFCVFLTSFLLFIVKFGLGFSIWIQKLKIERGINTRNDNSAYLNNNNAAGFNV